MLVPIASCRRLSFLVLAFASHACEMGSGQPAGGNQAVATGASSMPSVPMPSSSNPASTATQTTQPTGSATAPGTSPPTPKKPPAPGAGGIARPSGTPGNLKVLDWAGFKAAVSYTFDDTNATQIQHYDALQALGVPYTFYLITSKTSELESPVWPKAIADGHEIGNHTQSHSSDDDGSDTDLAHAALEQKFGIKLWTMAAPMGSGVYADIARTRYLINRGVSDSRIAPNDSSDPFDLPCFIPAQDAPASDFNEKVDAVRSEGSWQVMLVHGFTGGSDGAYLPVGYADFEAGVQYAKAAGDVWIGTVLSVGAYWLGQKAFTASQPTQSGEDTVWTWQLPEHFPPGQHLRVTVDGGTLTQGGVAIAWDDHGYYEVLLDSESLTLSP